MPLTRARQHTVLPVQHSSDEGYSDDVSKPKQQRLPSSKQQQDLNIRVPSSLCRGGRKSAPSDLSRTVSSPAHLASSSEDTKSTRGGATRSVPESRTTRRQSSHLRRQHSTTRSGDSDPSDDESTPSNLRIGGCSSDVSPLRKRDDSNKENVAPLRHVTQDVLASEAQEVENENVARRTRGRSSLTPRRSTTSSSSSSSAGSVAGSTAASSRRSSASTAAMSWSTASTRTSTRTSAAAHQRSSQRRASRASTSTTGATAQTTPNSRKRSADILDEAYHDSDSDFRLPNTPMRRLRLDTAMSSASDDAESYFSSQGSSSGTAFSCMFDSQSLLSGGDLTTDSRATTPATVDDVDAVVDDAVEAAKAKSSPQPQVGHSNVYAHARALFRYSAGTAVEDTCSSPSSTSSAELPLIADDISEIKVVGRQPERRALHAFMSKQLGAFATESHGELEDLLDGNCDSGSLYICGLPGTGKTALVRAVLSDVLASADVDGQKNPPRIAFVNCMSVDNPRQIYAKALQALGEEIRGASELHAEMEAEKRLEQLCNHGDRKILIVLDEIDHLLRSRAQQNILYRLFAWASGGTSCALIGIANSLDLTERFVPLLASKDAAPALLHFRPFESKEIVEVLKARLVGLKSRYDGMEDDAALADGTNAALASSPLFMPAALELASKKIAAATGDLRKALDAARLAIELVEGEQRKQALVNCTATGTGTNTEASKLLSHLTPSSAPKVTPQHILKVMTAVLGSPHLTKLRQLGLQPKLLLSAVVIAKKRASEKMPVLGSSGNRFGSNGASSQSGVRVCDVESTYNSMLENDGGFTVLESSEVLGLFELLEVQGIVALESEGEVSTVGQFHSTGAARDTTSPRSGVSPGGKRAAKKQLLACNRTVHLVLPMDDVQKGITTVASAMGSTATDNSSESFGAGPSEAVCASIRRMISHEEERIRRGRGWEAMAKDREEVRREELGGGRLAVV